MITLNSRKFLSIFLTICLILGWLAQMGCGSTPAEPPAPAETTPSPDTAPSTEVPTATETDPEIYNITYNLEGGRAANGNPDSYSTLDGDITLLAPIKSGCAFAGWIGTGLTEPTQNVTIPAGSIGDRNYTATWKEAKNLYSDHKPGSDPISDEERSALTDSHDNLSANPNELPISSADLIGYHGEGIFFAKTAYTDITVDGNMDNAYTYGLHFEMDMKQKPGLYTNRDTRYDVYMVCGQDGKMHVFVDVKDDEIIVNDEQWSYMWWHCDSFEIYIDFGFDRMKNEVRWTFAADETKKYVQDDPENWIVVMTEDGFSVEFEFDNNGAPFKYGDTFGFGMFYNDIMNYVSTENYSKSNTGTASVLNPEFHVADPTVQDCITITSYPLDYTGQLEHEKPPVEKTGNILIDVSSGASTLGIITSKYTTAYNEINAEKLSEALVELCIASRIVREDKLTDADIFDYVIYLNTADSNFASEAFDSMKYTECGVVIGDNMMAGFGWTWDANDMLCDIILSIFSNAASNTPTNHGERYVYTVESVVGDNIPKVEDTYCVVDSGFDAYTIVKHDTTIEYYNEYSALLEKAGYTLYTQNNAATVTTATYYDEKTVINLLYSSAEGDKAMRVIVETMKKTNLAPLEVEEYEKITDSSVTQINAWLCHIIKLDNGEFIIIDSGKQGTKDKNKIYNALTELNDGRQDIVIAAWIFTHFHQDHIGGFLDLLEIEDYMARITIKSIIYNPPERFFIDASISHSKGDLSNIIRWPGYIEKLIAGGTKMYQARTGQIFRFGNAEIEILGTFDDLAPFYKRIDESNHTSVHFIVSIEGQRLVYVGDATSPQLLLTAKRYGDYLKSDFVQISHHGFGDGGRDPAFYMCVDAPVVFHPGSALSGGAEIWAVENGTEYYNTIDNPKITIMLPYTPKSDKQ